MIEEKQYILHNNFIYIYINNKLFMKKIIYKINFFL